MGTELLYIKIVLTIMLRNHYDADYNSPVNLLKTIEFYTYMDMLYELYLND